MGVPFNADEVKKGGEDVAFWTIDLSYVLRDTDPSLDFIFVTKEPGLNQSHENLDFYAKTIR